MRPHRVCGRPALQQLSLLQQAAREQLRLRDGPVRQAQQNLRRRAGAPQDPSATERPAGPIQVRTLERTCPRLRMPTMRRAAAAGAAGRAPHAATGARAHAGDGLRHQQRVRLHAVHQRVHVELRHAHAGQQRRDRLRLLPRARSRRCARQHHTQHRLLRLHLPAAAPRTPVTRRTVRQVSLPQPWSYAKLACRTGQPSPRQQGSQTAVRLTARHGGHAPGAKPAAR